MILFGNMDQGRHIGGEKRVTERGRTRTLTVLNIHLFHTFSLVLVLGSWDWSLSCVIGRTSPWIDGQSITHIHTHYSLQFTCPICLWIVGERKPMLTWREHTNSTYKDSWRSWDSNTAHTAMHYTRLMIFLYYCFRINLFVSSFYIMFLISQVNFVHVHLFTSNCWWVFGFGM